MDVLQELKHVLCTVPEIVELVGGADAEQSFPVKELDRNQEAKAILVSIFSQILLSSKDEICEIISRLKWRLNLEKKVLQIIYLCPIIFFSVFASTRIPHQFLNSLKFFLF